MEDNEFEEVTIISHTSEEPSVLPESTAQRLLKSLRIEITQTVKSTSNERLGKLRRSKQPTELDHLFQAAIKGKPPANVYCLTRGPQQEYLIGWDRGALVLPNQSDKSVPIEARGERIMGYHILPLKEFLIVFAKDAPLLFVRDGEIVHRSAHKFGGSPSNYVVYQNENIYFVDDDLQMIMIDQDWTEQQILPQVIPADFTIDYQLNMIIVLSIDGFIISKNLTHRLSYDQDYHSRPFTNIVCAYRKFYVAARIVTEKSACELFLVEKWKKLHDVQSFSSEDLSPVSQIRFGAPRLSLQTFFVACGKNVRLWAIYHNRLHQLHDVKISSHVFCLTYLKSGWVACGENSSLTALKLNWSKVD